MKKEDADLKDKLEEIQKEKAAQDDSWNEEKKDEKDLKIIELENNLKEQTDIAKRAQYDLVTQKFDFERYKEMIDQQSKSMDVDSLVSTVKKFLPFVENLRKSLDVLSDEQREEPLAKWLQMIYDNFLKTLDTMNIKPIESIGLIPDSLLHEPVSAQPIEDKKLKWKIIQEFERGFVYEKDGNKKVIVTSKVVVWE